jgi:hypothetical protein
MNRVIPRYVPANTIEDRFGYLITAVDRDGARVYAQRHGSGWGPIGSAEFAEPLAAADTLKAMVEAGAEDGGQDGAMEGDAAYSSIQLVRAIGFLIPTIISGEELRKKRREAALAKLTPDELDALGLANFDFAAQDKQRQRGRR